MKDLNIMSLDLEMNQPSESIIQIGCVVGNLASGEILEEYSQHIKIDETIAPFIIKLTGITQENVNNGITLEEAYTQLQALHTKYECFRNAICWGGGDSSELRKQLKLDDDIFLFGRRWIDVKTVYISYRWASNLSHQAGLAKALLKIGMTFEGKKHNACDDARNTFYIYRELLEHFKVLNV